MTFWPSVFTLAASNVNQIDDYLSINFFQLYPFGRDNAYVALSTIYEAGRGGELVVARAGRHPGIPEHPADAARHHLAPTCSRSDSRPHRRHVRATCPHLVSGRQTTATTAPCFFGAHGPLNASYSTASLYYMNTCSFRLNLFPVP